MVEPKICKQAPIIMLDVALKEKMNKTKEKEKSTQVSLY